MVVVVVEVVVVVVLVISAGSGGSAGSASSAGSGSGSSGSSGSGSGSRSRSSRSRILLRPIRVAHCENSITCMQRVKPTRTSVIIWNQRVSSPVVIITMIDNQIILRTKPQTTVVNSAQEVSSLTKAVRNAGDHKGNYRSKEDFLGSLQIERWINEKTIEVWMDLLN